MNQYRVVTSNADSPHTQTVAHDLPLSDAAALRDKVVMRELAHGWCAVHWGANGSVTLARVTGRTVRLLCIGIDVDTQGVFRALVAAGRSSVATVSFE